MTKDNLLKIIGAFVFIFGIFYLLLSITNIFNDIDFIDQYNQCIDISKSDPEILTICKSNVSQGLNLAIRANQVELTTGQYLKVYIRQIMNVLFAVLMIIIGDFIYVKSKNKKNSLKEIKTPLKKEIPLKKKAVVSKKAKPSIKPKVKKTKIKRKK